MKSRNMLSLLLALSLCLFTLPCSCETSRAKTDSDLAWLMKQYDIQLSDELIQKTLSSFSPQTFSCGPVRITVQEVLYDGIWLHIATRVRPLDPEKTMIMPGDADLGDPVAGGYQEHLRDDTRSFQEAAEEDQRQLILVNLYPTEFDQADFYFLDHRQDAAPQSTLFAAAPIHRIDESLTIHISVELSLVDLTKGETISSQTHEIPMVIKRLGALQLAEYECEEDSLPFHRLKLVCTPLATYAFPSWKNEDMAQVYSFSLLDENATPLPQAISADLHSYRLPSLPKEIKVRIENHASQKDTHIFLMTDQNQR